MIEVREGPELDMLAVSAARGDKSGGSGRRHDDVAQALGHHDGRGNRRVGGICGEPAGECRVGVGGQRPAGEGCGDLRDAARVSGRKERAKTCNLARRFLGLRSNDGFEVQVTVYGIGLLPAAR